MDKTVKWALIVIALVILWAIGSCDSSDKKEDGKLVSGICSHCHGNGVTEYGNECGWCNGTGYWAYYD